MNYKVKTGENSATSQSFLEGQLITLYLLLIELKQLYPNFVIAHR